MTELVAELCIRESDLIPRPDKGADKFLVRQLHFPGAHLTVLPGGTLTGSDDDGEYQTFTRIGGKVVATCAQYPTGAYALPLAEGV